MCMVLQWSLYFSITIVYHSKTTHGTLTCFFQEFIKPFIFAWIIHIQFQLFLN